MRGLWYGLGAAFVLACAVGGVLLFHPATVNERPAPAPQVPQRIVSTVPSITEVLFALGLGERVVGVSTFCKVPERFRNCARVGGYFDPDYEAIVSLRPDLVLTMPEQAELRRQLGRLGLRCEVVRQADVGGILSSIALVGRLCGARRSASELVARITARMRRVARAVRGSARPRVLLCVERPVGTGTIEQLYCAGGDTFYDELITRAGGVNVLSGTSLSYPTLSKEEVLKLDPEVIVDIVVSLPKLGLTPAQARAEWDELRAVKAVATGKVHIVTEDCAVVPGPRFVDFLELLATLVHPEVRWN